LRDADFGDGAGELRARRGVEIDPALGRLPGAGRVVGEDLAAVDLDAECAFTDAATRVGVS
jgi:hypothetical protein